MNEERQRKEARIQEIEMLMAGGDFWSDKQKAQAAIKELQTLKDDLEGIGKYDKGDAIMTIFGGAGGADAEDFARILLEMYQKFFARKGFGAVVLHKNENDHGGFRNITLEIEGKNAYGTLKNESGVHRLVRISPFNAKQLRHTSFAMVEVIPKFEKMHAADLAIPENDLEISIARAGGPGGQNVNKRETAVRIVHVPSKLSVHVTSERSQAQNKEKAIEILRGKLWRLMEEERKSKEKGMYISKTTSAEWGSQIRSYVLHPYKMVKDHRTDCETSNIEAVLNGELDEFIEAEQGL